MANHMVALAVGRTQKADMQVVSPSSVNTSDPTGITQMVSFERVKDVIESGRAPTRPNRSRPINVARPTLNELLELAATNPPPSEFYEGDVECPW
jgi:hypothetical protein